MVGMQGENRLHEWRRNRNRILTELMKQPMHFSGLLRKLRASYGTFSSATLTGHLEGLLEKGQVKRQVEGRKIVYVIVEEKEDQTVSEMRKECLNELALLMFDYGICLTKKTKGKLKEAYDVLKESWEKREQDVDVVSKMLGIPQTPIEEMRIGKLKIEYEKKEGEK